MFADYCLQKWKGKNKHPGVDRKGTYLCVHVQLHAARSVLELLLLDTQNQDSITHLHYIKTFLWMHELTSATAMLSKAVLGFFCLTGSFLLRTMFNKRPLLVEALPDRTWSHIDNDGERQYVVALIVSSLAKKNQYLTAHMRWHVKDLIVYKKNNHIIIWVIK